MTTESQHRVVITGFAGITSCGDNITDSFAAIASGKTGIAQIQSWDLSDWEFKIGGEIKNYNPRKMIDDRKLLKLISRQDVIGLYAANQALAHSHILEYRESLKDANEFNDRMGVFVGSPGTRFCYQYDYMPLFSHAKGDMKKFGEGMFEYVHPMWLLRILPNNVLAYIGIQNNFKGPNENVVNHATSGMQAIAEAFHSIKNGYCDQAVAMGYDSGIEPQGLTYYGGLGALSKDDCRPFDNTHDGTILAEGAGALIIENYATAKARGATIYGEILADATTSEAKGVFPVREDADGLMRAIKLVLERAKLSPNDIGMVNSHGNATKVSDNSEALAIKTIFGKNSVPVTAYKWGIGHTLAAAGAIESILSLYALHENRIPGIANLKSVADDCQDICISRDAQKPRSNNALIISRAFGSINSCLIISSEI